MKKILLLTLAAITICVIGCDKKMVDDLLNPELSLTPAVITADAAAGKYNIAVTSNTAWVAAVDNASVNSWCRIESGATGMEKGTVTLALEANTTTAVRTATLSVSAGTLTQQVAVTQAAASLTLSLDKESISATVEADTYIIGVTSNATWTAASNAGWCTLADNSGNGNGTVTVNVMENSTASLRAATVTVSSGTLSQQVFVIQAASAATLSTDNTPIIVAATAGSYVISVSSNSTWTAAINTESADWCSVSPAASAGNGSITVTVAANEAANLRVAIVTLQAGAVSHAFSVTQVAAEPILTVDKTEIDAGVDGGEYSIIVSSNSTWTAAVTASTTWCTLSSEAGMGNGTVTVTVAPNPAAARAASVTLSAGTLSRQVLVWQEAAPEESIETPPHAASTQTWTFGAQIWSDAIRIPACNKSEFIESNPSPDCRSHTSGSSAWYYYNWSYVATNASALCPSPWRVPTREDLETLVDASTAELLVAHWGLPGIAWGSSMFFVGEYGYFWSSSEYDTSVAYLLYYSKSGYLSVSSDSKDVGQQVRCVH